MYYDGSSHCSYKLALRVTLWQSLGFCNTVLSNFLVQQQFTVHIPYYMEQSLSWAANQFSASQEIHRILGNGKVEYRIHKSRPSAPIFSQINPVHARHSSSWRPVLILSSHLHLLLQSDLFPSSFTTNTL